MSDDGTRLAGKLSIWLASLFAIVALIVGSINLFLDKPVPVPLDLVAGYLLGTLASFIAYVYGRSELILERQDRLLHQPARGVQVFTTSEEFLRKLVEITVGASTVSTLNLSPAKGEHPELDRYFEVVHSSIKNRKSPLRSFRSIASVDTVQKSAWLVERSCELHQTGRVSFAIFDQDRIRPLLHPLSLHITYKSGNIYVFIFPPVNLTGSMDSILISDPVLGKAMLDYYNLLWHDSLKINGNCSEMSWDLEGGLPFDLQRSTDSPRVYRILTINEGRQVRSQGLDRIVQLNPEIDANPFYQSLRKGLTL